MIVITERGEARLGDVANLKAFKLVAVDRDGGFDAAAQALQGAGYIMDGAGWIHVDCLRCHSAPSDEAWCAGFEAMLQFARSKGWYDETRNAIRAHIEWAPGAL